MKAHHWHTCFCSRQFICQLDIIPAAEGSRALCKEWVDSLCPSCMENILQHATVEDIASMIDCFGAVDPLAAVKVRELVG